MNKVNLSKLQQGIRTVGCDTVAPIIVQQTSVCEDVVCGNPTVAGRELNIQNITNTDDFCYEASFANTTGATRDLILGGAIGLQGEYQDFCDEFEPSATDFALFIQTDCTLYTANGGNWRGFNKMVRAFGSAIVCEVEISSRNPLQRSLGLRTGVINPMQLTDCPSKIRAKLCNECPTNNGDDLWVSRFTNTIPVGKANYLAIPIAATPELDPIPTTVRVCICAIEQNSILTEIGDCGF